MITQLVEKTQPYKKLILADDTLRAYYNALKAEDRAFLLVALASGYYQTSELIDVMLPLISQTYISILGSDITGFTTVPLNHNAYKDFFQSGKYCKNRIKFDILYSISGWIVKNMPNNNIEASILENITLSFMMLFIFDDMIEIPENITTFLDALGGADNL